MTRILAILALAAALVLGVTAPASADVDDFTFASFDGQYALSLDEDGHSRVTVVETLVAVFPEFDQNRGIRRLLLDRYDGHPTDLELQSVTDEAGNPRNYETDSDDGYLEVTIADDDVYLHGEQTYVITYTLRNVTKAYADTRADEFFWDVNGTDWAQPFEEVTATVTLGADLMAAHNSNVAAYSGQQGDTTRATVQSA